MVSTLRVPIWFSLINAAHWRFSSIPRWIYFTLVTKISSPTSSTLSPGAVPGLPAIQSSSHKAIFKSGLSGNPSPVARSSGSFRRRWAGYFRYAGYISHRRRIHWRPDPYQITISSHGRYPALLIYLHDKLQRLAGFEGKRPVQNRLHRPRRRINLFQQDLARALVNYHCPSE